MGTELVSTLSIYNIIKRALGCMDSSLLLHGEITGYIFYNDKNSVSFSRLLLMCRCSW